MEVIQIGNITGVSPANIAMKVHRIKDGLRHWFNEIGPDAYLAKPAHEAIQNVSSRISL